MKDDITVTSITIHSADCPMVKRAESSKPAQVASPEYRENYGRIFGSQPTRGQA